MSSNYPPGSDTKDAPWNQNDDIPEFRPVEFDKCSSCNKQKEVNDDGFCEECRDLILNEPEEIDYDGEFI